MVTQKEIRAQYRRQTRFLTLTLVGFIVLFSIAPIFLFFLNGFSLFGFSLDFYFISQGIILILVGLIFWFAVRQEHIDNSNRVNEDI